MCGFTGSYVQIPPEYTIRWTKKGDSIEVSAPSLKEVQDLLVWMKEQTGW